MTSFLLEGCSVEKSTPTCRGHFERAAGESRNPSTRFGMGLFFNRFLHFAPVLSPLGEMGASVEMTLGLFNRT
jgi:hypothetical protein